MARSTGLSRGDFGRACTDAVAGLFNRGRSLIGAVALLSVMSPQLSLAQNMSLPGSFAVGDTGAATYSVPIAVPPGTAGMSPSLTLSYSSQGANGIVGVGWSLDGLPSVGRCPRTWAQDGFPGGVNYDSNDRFCFEGQRLVVISGSYGADGAEYRTEIDGFNKVISHGTAGTGPAWFEVHTKSGQTMEFGHTADSLVLAQGKTTARSWAVSKVSDTTGNYFTVTYVNDTTNGQAYPSRVDYTGNSATNVLPFNSVQFVYASRSDVAPQYQAGSLSRTTVRLTDVKTFAGAVLVGDYRLTYGQGSSTQRSRLAALTVCDGASNCLPATGFVWQDSSNNFQALVGGNAATGAGLINSWNWGSSTSGSYFYTPISADVNGDGKTDGILVSPTTSGLFLYSLIGNGNGTFNLVGGNAATGAGLINGGNWGDSTGAGTFFYTPINADLNGDGKTDVVLVSPTPNGLFLYSLVGSGDGTFSLVGGNAATGAGLINNWNWGSRTSGSFSYTPISADVNGDGRADVVLVSLTADGLYVYTLIGNGNGTFNLVAANQSTGTGLINGANWQGGVTYNPVGCDLNGDGRSDIALVATTTTGLFAWSLIGNGDGTFNLVPGNKTSGTAVINGGNWQGGVSYNPVGGDLNGDGRSDIALVATTTTGLFAWSLIGNGDGTFNLVPGNKTSGTAVINSGNWQGGAAYNPVAGDLNGDGKSDIGLVAATASGLFVWSLIGNGDGTFNLVGGNASNGSGVINGWNWAGGVPYVPPNGDVNGDGKADVLLVGPSTSGLYVYSLLASAGLPDLLTGVTNGLGATTTISYQPLTNTSVYSKDSAAAYPLQDMQAPIYVVSRVDSSNGLGGTYSSSYAYAGAKLDLSGHGFLGFRQTSVTDLQTSIVQTTIYNQQFPYTGLAGVTKTTLNALTLNQSMTSFQFANASGAASLTTPTLAGAPYRVSVAQSTAQSADLDGSTIPTATTSYQYDAYGNATQVVVSTPDGFSKTTANTYTNDTARWLLGRLNASSVTSVSP